MNYTITNDDAKKIIMSRIYFIIPSAVIGAAAGFLTQNIRAEMLMIVLPVVLLLVGASSFVGLMIGKKKLRATRFIIDNNALIQLKNDQLFRRLSFNDQLSIKENMFGLAVKGPDGFIAIPKQLACYNEMKAELERRIVR